MSQIVLKKNYQLIKVQDKSAYVTRSVTYSKIDKDAFVERAADNSGIDRGMVDHVTDAICKEIRNFVLNGHSVEIPYLGTLRFGVRAKAAATAEEAGADKVYQRRIIFNPNKELKTRMNAVSLVTLDEAE